MLVTSKWRQRYLAAIQASGKTLTAYRLIPGQGHRLDRLEAMNPNHDPDNGQFTDGSGGSSGVDDASGKRAESATEASREAVSQTLREWISLGSGGDISETSIDQLRSGKASPAVKQVYAETQKYLNDRGESHRELFRGMSLEEDELRAIMTNGADFSQAASWSDDVASAKQFAVLNRGNGYLCVCRLEECPSNRIIAAHDIQREFDEVAEEEGFGVEGENIAAIGSVRVARVVSGRSGEEIAMEGVEDEDSFLDLHPNDYYIIELEIRGESLTAYRLINGNGRCLDRLEAAYDESKIERDGQGQFAETGGGDAAKSESTPEKKPATPSSDFNDLYSLARNRTLTQASLDEGMAKLASYSPAQLRQLAADEKLYGKTSKKQILDALKSRVESALETAINTSFADRK